MAEMSGFCILICFLMLIGARRYSCFVVKCR